MLKFSAPCIFGLEGLCANEFKFLGLKNVEAHNGKVTFEGDFSDMAKANINSRYAERKGCCNKTFRKIYAALA